MIAQASQFESGGNLRLHHGGADDGRSEIARRRAAKRRKQPRETFDVVGAARRMVRATGRRVSHEDTSDLQHLMAIQSELDEAWRHAVAGLRRTGYSDGDIGRELGITRQAIQKRWPRTEVSD